MTPTDEIRALAATARQIRRHVLTMSCRARAPHVASALSCVETLVSLYFSVARVDPANPGLPERDRIILSKGHAAAALYACLAERGFLAREELETFAADGSRLGEHPSRGVPGIECSTGSLGHGLGVGSGMAEALRLDGRGGRVFVILSDGECNEGSTWEAAMWAPARGLDRLTAIVDANGWQATGRSNQITALEPLAAKWRAFGWHVEEIDGHDLAALEPALSRPGTGCPRAIVARTVKGKGISFMENDLEWHYRPPSAADLETALAELGA